VYIDLNLTSFKPGNFRLKEGKPLDSWIKRK